MHILKQVFLGFMLLLPSTVNMFAEATSSMSVAINKKEDQQQTIILLTAKAIELRMEIHKHQAAILYAKARPYKVAGSVVMIVDAILFAFIFGELATLLPSILEWGGELVTVAEFRWRVTVAGFRWLVVPGLCGLASYLYGRHLEGKAKEFDTSFSISEYAKTLQAKINTSSDTVTALLDIVNDLNAQLATLRPAQQPSKKIKKIAQPSSPALYAAA